MASYTYFRTIKCLLILFLAFTQTLKAQYNTNEEHYYFLYRQYNPKDKEDVIPFGELKGLNKSLGFVIQFMGLSKNLKQQFLILKTNNLKVAKDTLYSISKMKFQCVQMTINYAVFCEKTDPLAQCILKNATLLWLESNYTKDTIRSIEQSLLGQEYFEASLNQNKYILSASLDHGKEGYLYFTNDAITKNMIMKNQAVLNSFFLPHLGKISYCSNTFCR